MKAKAALHMVVSAVPLEEDAPILPMLTREQTDLEDCADAFIMLAKNSSM